MTLNPGVQIVLALIAVLAPTITAIAAWRQSKKNATMGPAVDALTVRANEIHGLVNGARLQLVADLAVAQAKIIELTNTIAALELVGRRRVRQRAVERRKE